MANIWVRGFKFSNPTALRNVGFVQRSFAHVPKGPTGEDGNMAEKNTSIFTRIPNPISGGLIQMFSSVKSKSEHKLLSSWLKLYFFSTAPTKPGNDKGSPPQHNEKPGSKGAGKPAKDTGSDPKSLHEEPEAKNN